MGVIEANIRSFSYKGEDFAALKNVRFSVERGELVVLTGNSGCGKTTLMRAMNGLIPEQYEGELDGRIELLGKDLKEFSSGELARTIGNVFQNPTDQFFTRKVADEVAIVGENLGMPRAELIERVELALESMRIAHLADKDLISLSGGEKQRVAIASTLVYNTQVIFFDEPSASLDYEGIEGFRRILVDLKTLGKTVVIAEHRLYFLADLYDRLHVMAGGAIVDSFAAGRLRTEDCVRYGLRALDLFGLSPENCRRLGKEVASMANVSVSAGGRALIEPLTLSLCEGEVMGVLGVNGIGKSTLARVMCGLAGGRQAFSWGERPRQRLRRSYYMMQDVDYQLFFDTVENEILTDQKDIDDEYLNKVVDIIKAIDLWDKRTDHPQDLSGGQKQRLALACAFLSSKDIVVLDEPTSGLDFMHMARIAELIKELAEGRPVVVITHDLEFLFKICTSALMVRPEGCEKLDLRAHGSGEAVLGFMKDAR